MHPHYRMARLKFTKGQIAACLFLGPLLGLYVSRDPWITLLDPLADITAGVIAVAIIILGWKAISSGWAFLIRKR